MSPRADSVNVEGPASECERLVSLDASQFSVAASARHMSHKQHLGLAGLVCLIFLEVSGGPFGTEVRPTHLIYERYVPLMAYSSTLGCVLSDLCL